jgi:hypothetical protein
MRKGEHGTIVDHSAVFGESQTAVRSWEVSEVKPYAQYEKSLTIFFVKPGKRKSDGYRCTPENLRYYTIKDRSGETVYDSRDDVPCDMGKWQEAADEMKSRYVSSPI